MTLDDFRADFLSQVTIWAAADSNFSHSAFVDVAVHYLEEAGEVSDFEPCYYRGTDARRRNIGVDGYAFDAADSSLRLFLAEPTFSTSSTLIQTDAKAQFGKLRAFAEDAIGGLLAQQIDDNSPSRALADELRQRASGISRIRAFLLSDALLSTRVKDWPEGLVGDIPIEFHIWDISRFHRAYVSRSGQDDLVVDFSNIVEGGVPCIAASTSESPYASYLCIVPGAVLANIYDEYGSRLLEGNVRAFLSAKGKINKGIRNTILHDPEMFFAYNNGIAATATAVEVKDTAEGSRLSSATDLQIVNGGQTTASLAATRRNDAADLRDVFVPMKLSVIEPERSIEMIPLISRYANNQNKVSDADFFSNSPYHIRLETISRRMWAPARGGAQHETRWFYERARGQYVNATAAMNATDRKRFAEMNPRDQVITKTDLAKSENSWNQLPQKVSRGAQSNFLEFAAITSQKWDADRDAFNEDYFKSIVARIILFRSTEALVSKQPWYSGGYRANIVTYTIAKLASAVKAAGSAQVNFNAIWQRQEISVPLAEQLCAIAKAVYAVITSPDAGHENVTQWCKKDACWLRVQAMPCVLNAHFMAELIDSNAARSQAKESRARQKLDTGIDAQTAVFALGNDYWRGFLSWGTSRRLIAPEDERLIKMAAGISGNIPTDFQSKRLLIIKEKLELEGFPPANHVSENVAIL